MLQPISPEAFEKLVADALASLPEQFREKFSNVAIVIAPEPTLEQRRALRLHRGHTLYGLYEGVPHTVREGKDPLFPDVITIFQRSLEEEAESVEELKQMVRDTLWHEIAHHFGMDEQYVRRVERRRRTRE